MFGLHGSGLVLKLNLHKYASIFRKEKNILTSKLILFLILGFFLAANTQVNAEEQLTANQTSGFNKSNHHIEIGFDYAELSQNDFRNLGSSNYTFFIGQQFQNDGLKNWGWRFVSINVELSNEHLRNENEVKFIKGNRENLIGKLNHQRLYLDYYPQALLKHRIVKVEFIPSIGIGYNDWYLKDTASGQDHDVKAYTLGITGRLKMTFYDHFFIEAPNVDIAFIVHKNNNMNATIGGATIDRPQYIAGPTLLITIGYRIEF